VTGPEDSFSEADFLRDELMTPLTCIRGYVQMLLEAEEHSPEDRRRLLQLVERNSEQLQGSLEDLCRQAEPALVA
jgi:signal transduction histidine kinase